MNTTPLNEEFNCAVLTIANRLFPTGYDVAEKAPETLDELNAHIAKTYRMVVWNGASHNTIYGSPEVNWAFRAWHDWCHWRYQLPFTPEGERAAAYVQIAHIVRLYGNDWDAIDYAALILAEVVGQAAFYEATGQFPEDQVAFVRTAHLTYSSLAYQLVNQLEGKSDRDAIRLAKRHHKRLTKARKPALAANGNARQAQAA